MTHLFVYGTLMSSGPRASMVRGRREQARVRGRMYRMPAGYPALQIGGDDWVYGEVVEVPDPRILSLVDHYEGIDEGLFRRAEVRALVGLRALPAHAYVMDDPIHRGGVLIPSGRWRGVVRR